MSFVSDKFGWLYLAFVFAPYEMFDDNGVFSNDVEYTIAEAKGGYVLTVTASASWLNDAKRVYPVTVDPTLVKGGNNAAQVSDVYITEEYPAQNTNTYHRCNNRKGRYFNQYNIELSFHNSSPFVFAMIYTKNGRQICQPPSIL